MIYDIYDTIETKLLMIEVSGNYKNDRELIPRIFLAFANQMKGEFDQDRLEVLDMANKYWSGELSNDDRIKWDDYADMRMQQVWKPGLPYTRESASWALLSAALYIPNQGFIFATLEHFMDLVETIEFDPVAVSRILSDLMPEFAAVDPAVMEEHRLENSQKSPSQIATEQLWRIRQGKP